MKFLAWILLFTVFAMIFGCGPSEEPPKTIFRFSEDYSFTIDEATFRQHDGYKMLNVRCLWLERDPTPENWIRITWNKPHDIKPPELKSWYFLMPLREGEGDVTPFMLEIKGPFLSDALLVTLDPKRDGKESKSIVVPYGKPVENIQ